MSLNIMEDLKLSHNQLTTSCPNLAIGTIRRLFLLGGAGKSMLALQLAIGLLVV